MSENYDQINDEFLSLSPYIVCWHQITSLNIAQPFNSTHLHILFSQASNLRTLGLYYRSEDNDKIDLKEETLIDVLNDASLCNMLTSNGLRQLNLFTALDQSNLIDIAHLIVQRLPHLQVIELTGLETKLIEMSHILINSLSKLNFLIITSRYKIGRGFEETLRRLQNSNTRSFRTKVYDTIYEDALFVWL
jgi:hypothetical protein